MKRKQRKQVLSRLQQAQSKLAKLGYIARLDTRMGLQRMHVWHLYKRVSQKEVETILGNVPLRKMTVRKHPEQGVWVEDTL